MKRSPSRIVKRSVVDARLWIRTMTAVCVRQFADPSVRQLNPDGAAIGYGRAVEDLDANGIDIQVDASGCNKAAGDRNGDRAESDDARST